MSKCSGINVGSIEEDIRNLEKYIELVIDKNYCDCNELNIICYGKYADGSKNVANSIQNILQDYTRQKQINEEHQKINGELRQAINTVEKEKGEWIEECQQKDKRIQELEEELAKYKDIDHMFKIDSNENRVDMKKIYFEWLEYKNKIQKLEEESEILEFQNKQVENYAEELKKYNKTVSDRIVEYKKNSIPTQIVIDKVNEINKKYEDSKDENGESPYYYPDFTIRILQELLEGRNENG